MTDRFTAFDYAYAINVGKSPFDRAGDLSRCLGGQDPSNQTIVTLGMEQSAKKVFCFDRLEQDTAWGKTGKTLELSASRRWEKLCFVSVFSCGPLRTSSSQQGNFVLTIFQVLSLKFSFGFLSMCRWMEPGLSPDWTFSNNARDE